MIKAEHVVVHSAQRIASISLDCKQRFDFLNNYQSIVERLIFLLWLIEDLLLPPATMLSRSYIYVTVQNVFSASDESPLNF